jgi:hypothetical protein
MQANNPPNVVLVSVLALEATRFNLQLINNRRPCSISTMYVLHHIIDAPAPRSPRSLTAVPDRSVLHAHTTTRISQAEIESNEEDRNEQYKRQS